MTMMCRRSPLFCLLLLAATSLAFGCAPAKRLTFPAAPLHNSGNTIWYDVAGDGRGDFALLRDENDRVASIGYDDDGDGELDRMYNLDDYSVEQVPHLIILLDSIPFEPVAERYADGAWSWFNPPQKVIAPFPSMSGLIFTQMTGGPPMPGMINRHYDRRTGRMRNMIVDRTFGHRNPWQTRLHYHAAYSENGRAFLWPRSWFAAELARVPEVLDASGDRVTVVYIASTSGMISRFGEQGLDEMLDAIDQLTLQLLHERQGAIKISLVSDHGHNLMASDRISLDETLKQTGFSLGTELDDPDDVVVEMDGMVNYVGMHTARPAAVADALLRRHEVQLAMYKERHRVIVRDAVHTAAIERRGNRYRYSPLEGDVLGYEPVVAQLSEAGLVDEQGYIADADWFAATVDHEWPDAPRRVWDAFHGIAVSTPQLMITLEDGYTTGLGFLDLFIDMESTHGGLNQVNSATFVMSMTGRVNEPLRSMDVLRVLEPGLFDQP